MENFTKNDQRAIVAEFLGTLLFVFTGTGAVIAAIAGFGGDAALLTIATAHGLGILIAAAWTGNLSGGHINPAVTIAMLITKKIEPVLGGAYIVAQLLGAVAGSLLLKLAIPGEIEGALGAHGLAEGFSAGEGLLIEALLTFFLVLVIFNTAVSTKGWGVNAPIAIGFTVFLIHLVAVPWTGASVNPARSFGPALVANEWEDFWLYIVGPAVGAVVAAGFWMWWRDFGEDALDVPEPAPTGADPVATRA